MCLLIIKTSSVYNFSTSAGTFNEFLCQIKITLIVKNWMLLEKFHILKKCENKKSFLKGFQKNIQNLIFQIFAVSLFCFVLIFQIRSKISSKKCIQRTEKKRSNNY